MAQTGMAELNADPVFAEDSGVPAFSSDRFECDPAFSDYETIRAAETRALHKKAKMKEKMLQLKMRKKRKAPDSEESPFPSPAKLQKIYAPEKNPISILNELGLPGSAYQEIPLGAPTQHPTIFKITVQVNGEVYEGLAASKRQAKEDAARKAVNAIIERINSANETAMEAQAGAENGDSIPEKTDSADTNEEIKKEETATIEETESPDQVKSD